MRIVHVVGARPNFVKAAPVVKALARRPVDQSLIHTGQHYDFEMSAAFFDALDLPDPDVNLEVGPGSHAAQTAATMVGLEAEFVKDAPDMVVVYGDVNSTLAGALVTAKLQLPLAHVEAGLRSFDMSMPEEINRIVTDRLSTLLFTTSPEAEANLAAEGIPVDKVRFVGNPMIDSLYTIAEQTRDADRGGYVLVTLHRPSNVDQAERLHEIADELLRLADRIPIRLPAHPRGRDAFAALLDHPSVEVTRAVAYAEFVAMMRGAAVVVTDSGGIQEETTMLGIPCLTLRPNTERPITISHGTNRLVEPGEVAAAVDEILAGRWSAPDGRPPLWDGKAGERIAEHLAPG